MKSKSVKEVREHLGLNIADMARACGIHRQTWVKWERGECPPNAAAVRLMDVIVWIKSIGWLENFIERFVKQQQ